MVYDIGADILDIKMWISEHVMVWLGALFTLVIGMMLVRVLLRAMSKVLLLRDVDPGLSTFLRSVIGVILRTVVLIAVADMLGIHTTSLLAALGAAGLAVGLALQGSLSNFAGGVLILLFKPFRVGDYIEAKGMKGTVQAIDVLYTVLQTIDHRKIVIPNGNLSNNEVINYSAYPTRRSSFVIKVMPGTDLPRLLEDIRYLLSSEPRILPNPQSDISVDNLNDGGLQITIHYFTTVTEIANTSTDFVSALYMQLGRSGIVLWSPRGVQ